MHRTVPLSSGLPPRYRLGRYTLKCRRGRGRHPGRGHTSRDDFPALLGFALEAGAGLAGFDVLASVELVQAATKFLVEPGKLGSARQVAFFEKPERFPHDLARGIIAAGFDPVVDEFLEFRGKRNIHSANTLFLPLLQL